MITLQALNILLGTISAILLIFAELFKIRSHTLTLRIHKTRLRNIAYLSTLAFIATLLALMVDTFILRS
jgi:hypothetical protein